MFIGKSERGTVIHAITGLTPTGKNNYASCDKRQKGLIVDATLTASDITCSKCLQRADVKQALEQSKDPATAGIPTAKTKPKPKLDVKSKTTTSKKKTTSTTTSKAKEDKDALAEGDWKLKPSKKGMFAIVHIPSGKDFHHAPESVALDALVKLDEMDTKWSGKSGELPSDFIKKVMVVLKEAYEENGKEPPKFVSEAEEPKKKTPKKKAKKKVPPKSKTEQFKKGDRITTVVAGEEVEMEYDGKTFRAIPPAKAKAKAKKPTRTIKRREKKKAEADKPKRVIKRRAKAEEKPKRQIKRRSKKETLLGRTKGSPGYNVLQMLIKGTTMAEMVARLVKEHGLTEKKAWTKIRAVIRKTARKQGVPVIIGMTQSPGNDYYSLDDKHPTFIKLTKK